MALVDNLDSNDLLSEARRICWLSVLVFMLFGGDALAQDKKLDSLTISYASVSGTRAPLWIAKDLGLFEKYGLEGNLVYIASGVTSVNALLGGSVDIIAASGSSAVGAAARGAPLVIIASLGHIAFKLIAHPSITSVQGLKGKIIGSSRICAGTDFALHRLLPKLWLTPGKDVTLLATGISESDRRLLMLVQGKIDATLGTEDNLLQFEAVLQLFRHYTVGAPRVNDANFDDTLVARFLQQARNLRARYADLAGNALLCFIEFVIEPTNTNEQIDITHMHICSGTLVRIIASLPSSVKPRF